MMSETLDPVATELDQRQLAEQLLAQAKEQGIELVGPNGLLNQLTKNVLETALDAEMTEHLGYDKHDPAGRGSGNSRNGTPSQDSAHRDRPGRYRGPSGYQQQL
jgi:transposase-like protein